MSYLGIGSPIPDIANLPGQTGAGIEVILNYPSSSACFNASPFSPSVATPVGGTFSATPSGLNINSSTGEVTPIGSTEQTYVITYNVGGETSQFSLTISPAQQATFSYPASSFANTGTTSPTLAGGTVAGGTFSASPAGLSINSGTGEINLAASNPGGPYVVTYSTPGPCVGSAEFTITSITGVGTGLANVYSMNFDGLSDYIFINPRLEFGTNSSFSNFSASFWIKAGTISNSAYVQQTPLNFGIPVGNTGFSVARGYGAPVAQGLRARIRGSYPAFFQRAGDTRLDDGNWHHIVWTMTYEGSSSEYTLKIYVDGAVENLYGTTDPLEGIYGHTGSYAYGGLAAIGQDNTSTGALAGKYFDGDIDEAAIFDYALTIDNIQEIYNATASGVTANLSTMATPPIAWYRMGD